MRYQTATVHMFVKAHNEQKYKEIELIQRLITIKRHTINKNRTIKKIIWGN